MPERVELYAAVEIHADSERRGPGILRGTLLTYGEESRDSRRHVFAAGSLSWEGAGVTLNRQHNRGEPIARIVPTVDGGRIIIDHALPDTRAGRDAATEIRSGLMTGLSAEVVVDRDRMDGGRRLIERATLAGVGLVDRAAFSGSTVAVHAAQGRRGRRRIWL